jgi:hypothetical protein
VSPRQELGDGSDDRRLAEGGQGLTQVTRALPREGEAEGDNRVLRGGSWNNDNTGNFRCAYRNNNTPDNRNNNNVFRCASTLRAGVRTSTEAGACLRESRPHPGCVRAGVAEYAKGAGRLVASRRTPSGLELGVRS